MKQAEPNLLQPRKGEDLTLLIEKMVFGGRGLARVQTARGELVAFVPNAISGQLVRARIQIIRRNHLEMRLLEVLQPSPLEVPIPYQPIAGAPYITLPIAEQERIKMETCLDLFSKVGRLKDAAERCEGMISSPNHYHYRNKMEYAFAAIRYDLESGSEVDDFALGFKHRGTWWMVENLDADSGLFDAAVENNLRHVRQFCQDSGLPAWHAPKREGFFRFLTVRKSVSRKSLLINLVTTTAGLEHFDMSGFVALLQQLFGERLLGVLHTKNDDTGDRVQPLQGSSRILWGQDYLTEELGSLNFDVRMQSFFQTNPACADLLYRKALSYICSGAAPQGHVLDLFCGTGTIAQYLAQALPQAQVTGVELVQEAVADARAAATANGLHQLQFIQADVGRFLKEHPQYAGAVEAVVVDPPRAGIAPKALARTIALQARRLVYISCNPATLARDLLSLQSSGYELQKFAVVDQFPHTAHVEVVACFDRHR